MSLLSKQEKIDKIKQYLGDMRLDASVMNKTLGVSATHISAPLLLQTTKKLLQVYSREVAPDDRDNLVFSKFLGAEDYVKEHILHDAGLGYIQGFLPLK